MMLMVWPVKLRTSNDVRIESGMETQMISVARQLPRKTRIRIEVSAAAIVPSRMTPLSDAFTKIDWSKSGRITSPGGRVVAILGSAARIADTTESVEALPDLS